MSSCVTATASEAAMTRLRSSSTPTFHAGGRTAAAGSEPSSPARSLWKAE
jgi:hypothetical protein